MALTTLLGDNSLARRTALKEYIAAFTAVEGDMNLSKLTTPTANDWFRIPLNGSNAQSFTTFTGTTAYTFTGNYVYIKALVFNASAGSVESILLNH